MQSAANKIPIRQPNYFLPLFLSVALMLLGIVGWNYFQQNRDNTLRMEKAGGRNAKHSNQKARESAEKEYEKAKAEYEKLKSKPSKSKEDAELRDKLKNVMEHWRKKKDWKGENHSQKSKGN